MVGIEASGGVVARSRKFADNEKIYFGTGDDCYFYFDGTNMRFTTDAGNFSFQPVGGAVVEATSNIISGADNAYSLGTWQYRYSHVYKYEPVFIHFFQGAILDETVWDKNEVDTGTVTLDSGAGAITGRAKLSTGANANSEACIEFGQVHGATGMDIFDITADLVMFFYVELSTVTAVTNFILGLKPAAGVTDNFYIYPNADGNWHTSSTDSGGTNDQDTGIAVAIGTIEFMIRVESGEILVYINGTLAVTENTNPPQELQSPYFLAANGAAAADKILYIYSVQLYASMP